MTYNIASIDLPIGTISAVMSRAMATKTETLLPLINPVYIVDMSIECVEVFLFQKNTFVGHSNSLKSHVKKSRSFCFRRKYVHMLAHLCLFMLPTIYSVVLCLHLIDLSCSFSWQNIRVS